MSASPPERFTVTDRSGWVVGGRYRLVRRLASGGMATVYEGTHVLTLKRVAVKVLHPGVLVETLARERFFREAQAPASIGHPGIVDVTDAGVDEDGSLFLAMELLEGESFAAMLRRPPTTRREALEVVRELLDPLSAAHARGFVHRDLKPDNVFVARGPRGERRVLLLDFGIARASASHLTRTGAFMGTFGYASPEQARNPQDATAASDVWAVGVMLYRALAGRLPFGGSGVDAVMHAANEAHVPLDRVDATIPQRLARLVDRCLYKQPADRPADAGVLAAELAAALDEARADEALDATVPLGAAAEPAANASTVVPGTPCDTSAATAIEPDTEELPTRAVTPRRARRTAFALAIAAAAVVAACIVAWAVIDASSDERAPRDLPGAPVVAIEHAVPAAADPPADRSAEPTAEPAPEAPAAEAAAAAEPRDDPEPAAAREERPGRRPRRRARRRAREAPEEESVRYGPNMAPILR